MVTAANADMHESARDRNYSWGGRLVYTVFWLNVLALLIFVVGLFAGWFWPEATLVKDGQYRLSVVFNTREAAHDFNEVARATKNTLETGASAVEMETTEGSVIQIDTNQQWLQVSKEDSVYKINVTAATEWELDGSNDLSSLEIGDQVRVTLRQKGDEYFAIKVASAER